MLHVQISALGAPDLKCKQQFSTTAYNKENYAAELKAFCEAAYLTFPEFRSTGATLY